MLRPSGPSRRRSPARSWAEPLAGCAAVPRASSPLAAHQVPAAAQRCHQQLLMELRPRLRQGHKAWRIITRCKCRGNVLSCCERAWMRPVGPPQAGRHTRRVSRCECGFSMPAHHRGAGGPRQKDGGVGTHQQPNEAAPAPGAAAACRQGTAPVTAGWRVPHGRSMPSPPETSGFIRCTSIELNKERVPLTLLDLQGTSPGLHLAVVDTDGAAATEALF